MCGFTQSNRATFPSIRISFVVSNMEMLWWAEAGALKAAIAARIGVAAVRRLMVSTSLISDVARFVAGRAKVHGGVYLPAESKP
jgi:hypothetical protein